MQRPRLIDFGITEQDVQWARRTEQRVFFALLAASALAWSLYAMLTTRLLYPLLVFRALIVGLSLTVVSAFLLAIPARRILSLMSARYRRAQRYARACRRFRIQQRASADLADSGQP